MANAFGSTMNQSLENALLIGAGKANSAVDAAQAGLSAVLAGGGQIRSDTNSMRGQAQLVNTQAGSVNMTADELAALATTLAPYADKLGGYGDELSALATSLTEQANDKFGQADALVNMDPNASGLAGEYLKHYASLSPERYVSRAGSDAQASAENALVQNQRALARRGVSVGSGAGLGMRQQYARMLAELTSSAKTKAWDAGNKAQGEFLGTMTNAAKTFYDMGTSGMTQALSAKTSAGDMQKGAAQVIQAQGGLLQDAGSLRATAGTLYANAASIFGSAAGIENDYLNLVESSYKTLSGAWNDAAKYYLDAAATEVSANNGGRARGSGGVTVTQSPSDDWMNWKGTGHSATWNRNNNPGFWSLANNGEAA